jgi:hypothetical protein
MKGHLAGKLRYQISEKPIVIVVNDEPDSSSVV